MQTTAYSELTQLIDDKRRDTTAGSVGSNEILRAANETLDELANGIVDRRLSPPRIINTSFDFSIRRYLFSFFNDTSYYNIGTSPGDYKDIYDLRRADDVHDAFFHVNDPEQFASLLLSNDPRKLYTVEFREGNPFLGVNHNSRFSSILLNDCESLTSDGLWVADTSGSDAASVAAETVIYNVGSGSVKVVITVGQSGNDYAFVYNSTISAKDLTNYLNVGTVRLKAYLSNVTNLTSITVRVGTDASNYYEFPAITTDAYGDAFAVNTWMQLSSNWSSATTVGSPTITSMSYVSVKVAYSSSYTGGNLYLDDIQMARGETLGFWYYSQYLVKSSAGVFQKHFSATTDTIDSRAVPIIVNGVLEKVFDQTRDYDSSKKFRGFYVDSILAYMTQHPPRKKRSRTGLSINQLSWER